MMRSRSSTSLLPTTTMPRIDSRGMLGGRRRGGGSRGMLNTLLAYVLLVGLLTVCTAWYVSRASSYAAHAGGGGDDVWGEEEQLRGGSAAAAAKKRWAAGGAGSGRRQRNARQDGHSVGLDSDVDTVDAAAVEQAALEREHLAALQAHLEAGGHADDPAAAAHIAQHIAEQQALPPREGPSLYALNLTATGINGEPMRTADLNGKVTIWVNTASQCGYTDANYRGLQRLYQRYADFGLQILAFPCNQFGQQEPGTLAEIEAFAGDLGVAFPLFTKVDVNGEATHPIFAWLKEHTPGADAGFLPGEDIRWNFEKFLVDKHGHPVRRYGSELRYHDLELDTYNELIRSS